MTPEIGQHVIYILSDGDASAINTRRTRGAEFGVLGNTVTAGQGYPGTVVATWGGSTVNLQVHLDGNDTYWATSRPEGTQPGQWHTTSALLEAARETAELVHHGHWPSFRSSPQDTTTGAPADAGSPVYDKIMGDPPPAEPAAPAADVPAFVPATDSEPEAAVAQEAESITEIPDPSAADQPPASSAPDEAAVASAAADEAPANS